MPNCFTFWAHFLQIVLVLLKKKLYIDDETYAAQCWTKASSQSVLSVSVLFALVVLKTYSNRAMIFQKYQRKIFSGLYII